MDRVVRIINPSSQPALPRARTVPIVKKGVALLQKVVNILTGSAIGLAAGAIIYLMLKSVGVNFGGMESSIIIGLPAVLGIVTSFVIF